MAKRILDIFISFIAIIILVIPCVFISISILLTSPGPVIYWSRRMGSKGTYFMMPKFRTMLVNTPEIETNKLSDPLKYLTPIGSFLRYSSIDEIPQLFSVFIGDMSLVGPRPALYNQFDIISKREVFGINDLKPGMTGWAQINGRDNLSLQEKINFDNEYLIKKSIYFDLKILIKTIYFVIKTQNVKH
jgi:O-antigen biosynthesis protein WbqP